MNNCLNVMAVIKELLPWCMIQEKMPPAENLARVAASVFLWKTGAGTDDGRSLLVDQSANVSEGMGNRQRIIINHLVFVKSSTSFPQPTRGASIRRGRHGFAERPRRVRHLPRWPPGPCGKRAGRCCGRGRQSRRRSAPATNL